ncbi:DUF1674 domain-containing protein [Parvibaculum sedimenti]|uniref:DUF1674 domain-containing protein n=1 Tax=Parvibaculum sedimenti TaxID=2608632 RepID=A0A6N6VS71_9HYPH|nr:DUF1674 domain-containing protein [Parvibaculum sedimenti]KAB7742303.1 DUF1674 domain-containing protein [Parvibaculum sedimenti]
MSGETENQAQEPGEQAEATPPKVLSPAARRALAEAEERRRAADAARAAAPAPREINGPKGLELGAEPTRYGDWEVKGIVSDF